jgi:ABC-type nitrate/sulfonate/bicarbonate transport system substrate-binding protein
VATCGNNQSHQSLTKCVSVVLAFLFAACAAFAPSPTDATDNDHSALIGTGASTVAANVFFWWLGGYQQRRGLPTSVDQIPLMLRGYLTSVHMLSA